MVSRAQHEVGALYARLSRHRYAVIFPRMHSQRANRLERDVLGAQNMAAEKLQLSPEEWKRIETLARS